MAKSLRLLLVLMLLTLASPTGSFAQPVQPEAAKQPGPAPGVPRGLPGQQPPRQQQPVRQSRPPFPFWNFFPILFIIWLVLHARQVQQQAQKAQQQREDEEETKTPYDEGDLMDNWEFKIVRNKHNFFDQPALLDEALRAEALAGWQLVEKFDGNRLRLKRPADQRAHDANLPTEYDPYRTVVLLDEMQRIKEQKRAKDLRTSGLIFGLCGGLTLLLALVSSAAGPPGPPGLLGFLFFMGALIAGAFALIGAIIFIIRLCGK